MSSVVVPLQTLLAVVLPLVASVCIPNAADARDVWRGPSFALPRKAPSGCAAWFLRKELPEVERLYAQANELEDQSDAACVDLYFCVAVSTAHRSCCKHRDERAFHLHQSSLQKLVITGQQFGRLDPRCGLNVHFQGVYQTIPIRHLGFVWPSEAFDRLIPVGDYHTKSLRSFYRSEGVGIPLVVSSERRDDHSFRLRKAVFSATLRLCTDANSSPSGLSQDASAIRIEMYDPMRIDRVCTGAAECPIAKDLTAPLAYRMKSRPRDWLEGFIRPRMVSPESGNAQGALYTIEPYQRGKTPVVLIHGLLSDRFTWAEMVNELLARPGFVERYQIWIFEYPTGRAFLASAAQLREQLEQACRRFDPQGTDPELSNIVMVGHSMGGLVAKMQITSSGCRLWNSVAKVPLNQIVAPPQLKHDLAKTFFFEPSPRVSRVVYIATPHRGSGIATRMIGRIGASLVDEGGSDAQVYADLIQNNPDVFSSEITRRIPTSIDLLEPGSELLRASDSLPVRCGVAVHSIIGNGCLTCSLGRSDGVVPVKNAKDRHAITERYIRTTHSGTKEHPESVKEILSILELHRQ